MTKTFLEGNESIEARRAFVNENGEEFLKLAKDGLKREGKGILIGPWFLNTDKSEICLQPSCK